MSNTLNQLYFDKSVVLARTMVVKFHEVAIAINRQVRLSGFDVDESRPETWKYYLNLNGEYHPYDHAKLLELSNGEHDHLRIKIAGDTSPVEVNYSKDILYGVTADLAVANEYRFNTLYYNELVTKYPDFIDIINGVLNPIKPEISLNSKDGEILYCGGYLKTLLPSGRYHFIRQDYGPISDNFLIEDNEENLIGLLQENIYRFLERWDNRDYHEVANLYYPFLLGVLYMSVPNWINNIRLGNIKSPLGFTHSYHIRNYLDSFGKLGWVLNYIKKPTALWLYRNIRWLDANKGKTMTFNSIVENVLTPENIPLTAHRLRHDISEVGIDGVLVPKPFMERKPVNFIQGGTTVTYNEISEIIKQELPLAVENYYDQPGQTKQTSDKSKYSMFDNVNTKVLESTVVDMSNHLAVTLDDIALNLWPFSASQGLYKGTILVTNPLTSERIQLTPLSAFILALYCLNKGWCDWEIDYIPTIYVRNILRSKRWKPYPELNFKPVIDEVKQGLNPDKITDDEINEIIGNFEPVFTFGSSTFFNEEMVRQHREAMRQYYAYTKIEDMDGRAYGEFVSYKQYWHNVKCELVKKPTKFSDWIITHGINLENFTRKDFVGLGLQLVEAATGLDIAKGEKLRNKQNAVLSILRHFASYTIQVIQNSVSVDSYVTGGKTLRLTNVKDKLWSHFRSKLVYVDADISAKVSDINLKPFSNKTANDLTINEVIKDKVKLLPYSYNRLGFKSKRRDRVILPSITVNGRTKWPTIEIPIYNEEPLLLVIDADSKSVWEGETVTLTITAENVKNNRAFRLTIRDNGKVLNVPFELDDDNSKKIAIKTTKDYNSFKNRNIVFEVEDTSVVVAVKVRDLNLIPIKDNGDTVINLTAEDIGLINTDVEQDVEIIQRMVMFDYKDNANIELDSTTEIVQRDPTPELTHVDNANVELNTYIDFIRAEPTPEFDYKGETASITLVTDVEFIIED